MVDHSTWFCFRDTSSPEMQEELPRGRPMSQDLSPKPLEHPSISVNPDDPRPHFTDPPAPPVPSKFHPMSRLLSCFSPRHASLCILNSLGQTGLNLPINLASVVFSNNLNRGITYRQEWCKPVKARYQTEILFKSNEN